MPFRRHHEGKTGKGSRGAYTAGHVPLGTWIRLHGVDLVTMALMGAIGMGVYFASPAPNRSFPVYFSDGQVVYPQFAYPLRKEIIPIWAAALIAFFVPFFFICLFQARRRSLDDLLTSTMGVLKSLITAAVFQVLVKWLIGGLRPHFYSVCQPSVAANTAASGIGFNSIMYDRSICTGDKNQIDDALESMPSGHSTAAFAGLIYLALYFNAQLKVMSAHNPAYWKMVLFFAPILGAVLIAGSLTIDEYHNWYDVVAGAIIGSLTAYVAFRQTFAAVFDFRFNHLLLPRTSSIFHRKPFTSSGSRGAFFAYPTGAGLGSIGQQLRGVHLPFTREGGWANGEEACAGAPFDAASAINAGSNGLLGGGHNVNNASNQAGYADGAGYDSNNLNGSHQLGHGGELSRAEAGVGQPQNGVTAPGTTTQQTPALGY